MYTAAADDKRSGMWSLWEVNVILWEYMTVI